MIIIYVICLPPNSEQKQAHSMFPACSILYAKYGYITQIRNSEPARGGGGGGGWKHNPAEKLYFSRKQRIGCSQLTRWCSLAGRNETMTCFW